MLPPVAGSKRLDRALAGGAEGQKIFLFGIADNALKSPDSRKEIPWNSFTLIWSGFPLAWIGFTLALESFPSAGLILPQPYFLTADVRTRASAPSHGPSHRQADRRV